MALITFQAPDMSVLHSALGGLVAKKLKKTLGVDAAILENFGSFG